MRHILPIAVQGTVRTEAGNGARRHGECVSTFRFDSGAGKVDCQTRVSAPVERGAAAAPRRPGPHHRLPDHDLRRRRGAGARAAPAGSRRSAAVIEALAERTGHRPGPPGEGHESEIPAAPPRRWSARCRPGPRPAVGRCIVADSDGAIVGSIPNDPEKLGRQILDVLGPSQPLTTFGAAAGTLEITLPNGARRVRHGAGIAQSARHPRRRRDRIERALPAGDRPRRSLSPCRQPPASWC